MKFPDRLYKVILDKIIHIGAVDFIKYDKDGNQYEGEDSINDASVLSSDEEKE